MWDLIVSVPDHCLSIYLENYERVNEQECKAEAIKYCIIR